MPIRDDPARAQPQRPEEVNEEALRQFVGYNLKRAYMTVRGDFISSLADLDLRPSQFSALSLVVDNPDMTQSMLAQVLSIERSGVVLIVDELERRELISRNKVKSDRRAYALRATLKGVRLRDRAVKACAAHEDRLLADLSMQERSLLIDMLKRIEV